MHHSESTDELILHYTSILSGLFVVQHPSLGVATDSVQLWLGLGPTHGKYYSTEMQIHTSACTSLPSTLVGLSVVCYCQHPSLGFVAAAFPCPPSN